MTCEEPGRASYVMKCVARIPSAGALRVVNDFAARIVYHSLTSSAQAKAQVYVLIVEEIPLVEAADCSKCVATENDEHASYPIDVNGTCISRIIGSRLRAEELCEQGRHRRVTSGAVLNMAFGTANQRRNCSDVRRPCGF